jgi:hypothetical protein
MNKSQIIFTLIIVVLIALGYIYYKPAERASVNYDKSCYIWNTEAGDSAQLVVEKNNNDILGNYKFSPFEKDSRTATFYGVYQSSGEGTGMINAQSQVMQEGTTTMEELKISITGDIASIGFGEMKDNGSGMYIYANPDAISYSIPLQKTDCSDPAIK